MSIIHLADRGVVKVVGDDARSFLNGILTSDMNRVSPGHPRFAGLLTPQGKLLIDMIVTEAEPADGGGFFIDCPLVLAPDLVRRCNLYKLRSKVIIEDLSAILAVAVVMEGAFPHDDFLSYPDPRLPDMPVRLIGERNQITELGGDSEIYLAKRVHLAIPEGGKDFAYGEVFPHEALMDQIGGVDFTKGCYVGQEVVSRMEHRGTARTRIVPVRFAGGFAPESGTVVEMGEIAIGRTGSQVRGEALAMLRLDRVADAIAKGIPVTAGGMELVARKPGFARFEVPAATA